MSLFINQNGRIACSKHGGFYLERLVENDERVNRMPNEYTTPLDHWLRIPEEIDAVCEEPHA